ncbi:MAG: ATP-binding protein [Lachnospiraceae bacterium]|nr:ATP-binding protein [Lachnospiraceae bacterium]
MNNRKLPIGIQDFESLRNDGYLYVDKTRYIYELAHKGKPYFLSRPRRFGKSLLLSTMRAYFEGKRELFEGLAIEELESGEPDAWQEYPVFYFDFNKKNFQRETALEEVLTDHLKDWESIYGDEHAESPLEERFQHLIVKAVEQTGRNAVVLVDEYDKPLLETITDDDLEEHNKAVFKGFFSTLKSYDHYLKFVFLTGVTKFSKVSIFSDLNQLQDISLDADYAEICGIKEEEMKDCFMPEIERMAESNGMSVGECLTSLRKQYDGYHFHPDSMGVYNPFSLINALQKREFGYYWFSTGTPTFLLKKLEQIDFDAKQFTGDDLYASPRVLSDYRADNPDPIPLFYQTGYLTICGYDRVYESCKLGYPNNEVKYGFLESLAPYYLHNEESASPLDVRRFGKDLEKADLDSLRERFTALFARLPYTTDEKPVEQNFQNVVYIVFMLLGKFVHTEVHSAKGRADCIVETDDYVYIFEFKRDDSADEALRQIEDKGYAKPYAADKRKLYRIGVNFDSKERTIDGWEVRENEDGTLGDNS